MIAVRTLYARYVRAVCALWARRVCLESLGGMKLKENVFRGQVIVFQKWLYDRCAQDSLESPDAPNLQ